MSQAVLGFVLDCHVDCLPEVYIEVFFILGTNSTIANTFVSMTECQMPQEAVARANWLAQH